MILCDCGARALYGLQCGPCFRRDRVVVAAPIVVPKPRPVPRIRQPRHPCSTCRWPGCEASTGAALCQRDIRRARACGLTGTEPIEAIVVAWTERERTITERRAANPPKARRADPNSGTAQMRRWKTTGDALPMEMR